MFKSIYNVDSNDNIHDKYWFELNDSDFRSLIQVRAASHNAAAVIIEYLKRDLPIVPNLVAYYLWYNKLYNLHDRILSVIKKEKIYIDAWYPELKYGGLYFEQVMDKFQKIILVS